MTRRELVALLLVALPGVAWIRRRPRCWQCGLPSSESAVRAGLCCDRCWKEAGEARAKAWHEWVDEWYVDGFRPLVVNRIGELT